MAIFPEHVDITPFYFTLNTNICSFVLFYIYVRTHFPDFEPTRTHFPDFESTRTHFPDFEPTSLCFYSLLLFVYQRSSKYHIYRLNGTVGGNIS
jgi:hypothetical protein